MATKDTKTPKEAKASKETEASTETRECSEGMMDFFNISAKLTPLPEPGAGERNLARLPG